MTGTPSRTARDVTARCGLKEAGGELPARGTRTASEACRTWARRRRAPNPKIIRRAGVYMRRVCGRKVTRLTPGGLASCLRGLGKPEGGPMGRQKSAGAIRGGRPPKGSAMRGGPVRPSRRLKEVQTDG